MINWKSIEKLAKAHHRETKLESFSEPQLRRYLEYWWCIRYERPFKDPLLRQYTLDELAYEFLRISYLKDDPIEAEAKQAAEQDDLQWAQEQLKKAQKLNESATVKHKTATNELQESADQLQRPELPPDISTSFTQDPLAPSGDN